MHFKNSPKVFPFGQTHPWVVPLGMSHLNFPRPIELSKIKNIDLFFHKLF
jgi:hypothetical protein